MDTNRDRLHYLKNTIHQLNEEIKRKKLEDKYLKLLKRIKSGEVKLEPVSDEDWAVMLPKEKEANLLAYYHTLRTELNSRIGEIKRLSPGEKIAQWLDQPFAKVSITAIAVIEFAITLVEAAHTAGILYQEENLSKDGW